MNVSLFCNTRDFTCTNSSSSLFSSNKNSTSKIKRTIFPNAAIFLPFRLNFQKVLFSRFFQFSATKNRRVIFQPDFDFSIFVFEFRPEFQRDFSLPSPTVTRSSSSFFQPDFFSSLMALVFQGHRLN